MGQAAALCRFGPDATARDLLRPKGYDTESTVLTLYGGAGFTDELITAAATEDRIRLVSLDRLYA